MACLSTSPVAVGQSIHGRAPASPGLDLFASRSVFVMLTIAGRDVRPLVVLASSPHWICILWLRRDFSKPARTRGDGAPAYPRALPIFAHRPAFALDLLASEDPKADEPNRYHVMDAFHIIHCYISATVPRGSLRPRQPEVWHSLSASLHLRSRRMLAMSRRANRMPPSVARETPAWGSRQAAVSRR